MVGGINMDIGGSPAESLVLRDSNPGRVSLRPGGVGRNIAHDLRLLGLEVSLVTALGDDLFGDGLMESCEKLGLDMSMSQIVPHMPSSTYLYLNDAKGDMYAAVADMEISRTISPAYLAPLMERINRASALVLDANLEEETIAFLAREARIPIYADSVSRVKSRRLLPALGRLRALKPNAIEALELTGEKEPDRAARALIQAGVERVFLSLGQEGMLAAQGEELIRLPVLPVRVLNTTGAGDAATAAMVAGDLLGLGLEETARAAMRAGALTTQCTEANNPAISAIFQGGPSQA